MAHSIDDLDSVISDNRIVTYFHPIIALSEKEVVGFEALGRGLHPDDNRIIPPLDLIDHATSRGRVLELDRAFRQKALEAYSSYENSHDKLLFLNLNASILSQSIIGSGHLADAVRDSGLSPDRVAIELIEARVADPDALKEFTERYRDAGFLIVIDDFGTEHSNLERLIHVRPDVIKIDRNIISGIENDYYKQSVFKSVVELSKMIGALSLAEGVETIEEVQLCARLGANLFQGFYFSRPDSDFPELLSGTRENVNTSVRSLEHYITSTVGKQRELNGNLEEVTRLVREKLSGINIENAESEFRKNIGLHHEIECMYLLDQSGKQITETVCRLDSDCSERHALFQPAPKGTDHSLKNYYYYMKNLKLNKFFTDSYLSLATGNLCRTMAVTMHTSTRRNCILCIDFLDGTDAPDFC